MTVSWEEEIRRCRWSPVATGGAARSRDTLEKVFPQSCSGEPTAAPAFQTSASRSVTKDPCVPLSCPFVVLGEGSPSGGQDRGPRSVA